MIFKNIVDKWLTKSSTNWIFESENHTSNWEKCCSHKKNEKKNNLDMKIEKKKEKRNSKLHEIHTRVMPQAKKWIFNIFFSSHSESNTCFLPVRSLFLSKIERVLRNDWKIKNHVSFLFSNNELRCGSKVNTATVFLVSLFVNQFDIYSKLSAH